MSSSDGGKPGHVMTRFGTHAMLMRVTVVKVQT